MNMQTNPGRLLSPSGFSVVAIVAALTLAGALVTFSAPPAKAQSTVNVSIQNHSFNPANITVVIGINNTITWTNLDPVTHTVTGNDGSWGSPVPPGTNYTHTFTTAGVFAYHCSIHTYMHGAVTVLSPSNSTTSGTTTLTSTTSLSATNSSTTTATTPTSSTTTSQAVTSQTESTVTSSAASPSTTQSSSASSGQVPGVPEFPVVGVGILVLTVLLVAAYFATRKTMGPRSSPAA